MEQGDSVLPTSMTSAGDDDLTVEIAFVVRKASGRRKARIAVEYDDNNWGDVLALEKLVIPDLVSKLFTAGDVYIESLGVKEQKLTR